MVIPTAAVVIIRNQDGKILSATRKDDVTKYCFPGGKLDLGEDPIHAAARELMEETGIRLIESHYLGSLFDGGFLTHCFYAIEWDGEPRNLEPGVNLEWLTEEEIGNSRSAYPEYNTEMIRRMQVFLDT